MEGVDEEVESILYMCREVSVFKIPPLKKNEGHRAQEWGDLGKPLWKGRLKIIEKSSGTTIMFEDPNTGAVNVRHICCDLAGFVSFADGLYQVFASTPYDPAKPSIEGVLDSSRYFVVRVEDAGKKAYVGMGFLERSDSFDFNVALQDYTKRWKARMNPPSPTSDKPSPHVPPGPKKDYSLKDGQTFSISIPGRSKAHGEGEGISLLGGAGSSGSRTVSGGGGIPLLPPPPKR